MAGRLERKVAIVTGAATGIGEAIAHKFAKEGAKVVVNGLADDPVDDVVSAIKQQGGQAVGCKADVSEEIGAAKPERRAFDVLAERLATPPGQMVFIGDHPKHDVAGARAAGMRAELVERSGTCTGLAAALASAASE